MNKREERVKQRYEADGWKVLRGGAPDFLMLKIDNGKIKEIMFVEVKSSKAELTDEQAVYRKALEDIGIGYKLEVEK